ncbi:glucose-6-phosphate 1-dehydrogenase [Caldanaerobius fijiensis DSM 17918]|uniref:Glucose-6-phosphate 1-dehydrogenase n=1 Tax=Caldanaerobius fijiensis DSM 17918 TaxID=1121256 RepID=A0A1M4STL9_9THEO|nr:glucose-6-phosphate dehydrogenase [Caldanaerobius fijiensis]SHE35519.1 glucose-6-phosphate 1-dehydrogenase [Caldanaerobius fijiensis DSM 17918]
MDNTSCLMVIFGGTGDLTKRKLLPAIYNLYVEGLLPDNFATVAVGRKAYTHEEYRMIARESVMNFSRNGMNEDKWSALSERIYYEKVEFHDPAAYVSLKNFLNELDKRYQTKGNRVYYLAVAPEYFEVIAEQLHDHKMAENNGAWQRVVIEKPFGRDLRSAEYLNQKLSQVFDESHIYRIDHYLGKEMLQNIMVIRFANGLFEPIWNNRYIDNVQISIDETVGVENRGNYYEKAGALRDMVQSHMLQLLSLVAMEPPIDLSTDAIRDEKVKVLRSLRPITRETVSSSVVRGQYGRGTIDGKPVVAYREEERVSPDSDTETFVALKTYVDNFRWAGVPFYLRTGKRLADRSAKIVIQFKQLPGILYFKEYGPLEPNLLVIWIQPREGVYLQFNAKKPGQKYNIVPVQMDFCQNCSLYNNSPEAYERLLYDVMRGDSTLFTRWDEVEYSWRFVDSIVNAWKDGKDTIEVYEAGTWGPTGANELLKKDGFEWWNITA